MKTMRAALICAALASLCSVSLSAASTVTVRRSAIVNCGVNRHALVRVAADGRERVTCVTSRPYRTTHRVVRRRSWKKSAAVIGGSTAAGAGVGALVGGGKGALIGAAAGGAAGTVYEVHKRHQAAR